MRLFVLLAFLAFPQFSIGQSYKNIHRSAIVCDTHNDIVSICIEKGYQFDTDLGSKSHTDLRRLEKGGVDVQVFSIFCDGEQKNPFAFANQEIDSVYAWASRNPSRMQVAHNSKELKAIVKGKKLAAMLGVEGGHMIENNLDHINRFYERGVRYMTLTWNNNPSWASSAAYETGNLRGAESRDSLQPHGLNEFGKSVVKRMNDLGMIIDLSHVGEKSFWDVMGLTNKPVIASHSNVYTLCPVFRNLKDDQIKAIAKNGGVIQLNFYASFLDTAVGNKLIQFIRSHRTERDGLVKTGMKKYAADDVIFEKYAKQLVAIQPPLQLLIDHMEYIIRLVGVDHVGLGGDFDGITLTPQKLTDVSKYVLITRALKKRGYSKKDIHKILGGNFIRVLEANERK